MGKPPEFDLDGNSLPLPGKSTARLENAATGLSAEVRRCAGRTNVRSAPIVLKKFFLGDERNFLGPLMGFARGDVRDHIVSHKNSHRPSYRRKGALQRSRQLRINFREIFGAVRFSTFSTVSARSSRSQLH
jgi:hypothetical protein